MMLAAQESVLFTEELQVKDFLFEYTVLQSAQIPETLSAYDVIVISTPPRMYGESEIKALKAYVESGGGLMLLAEENNKDGTTLVLNQIAQEFSITFNSDRVYDDESYLDYTTWVNLTRLPLHPVFEGIASIIYTSGCSLEVKGTLVQASKGAYAEKYDGLIIHKKGDFPVCMAFLTVGKGRVFACGDKELFDKYLNFRDNTLFGMNVFDWLAGNTGRISERLKNKSEALQFRSEAESLVQSAVENGLKEVFPENITTAESLISEAKILYDSYRYAESRSKALDAQKSIREGESKAQALIDSKMAEVEDCLSRIEKSAQQYLPSQLEAARYYVRESEKQTTYSQKLEKLNSALSMCDEIRTELKGAAEKEISLAKEKVKAYKGLFGRASHHSAEINVQFAEESYAQGEYSDAIEYAKMSQSYSDIAVKEEKKDYYLGVGVILIAVLVIYVVVRK